MEEDSARGLSRQELRARGFESLPDTLGEAVELFAESELMKEVLGEHIHSFLVKVKREEWNEYQRQVSSQADRYSCTVAEAYHATKKERHIHCRQSRQRP